MSPETHEVMSGLADELYADLVRTIAKGRNKSEDTIRAVIDDGPFLSKQALAKGLVDELRYEDQVLGELKTTLKQPNQKNQRARLRQHRRHLSHRRRQNRVRGRRRLYLSRRLGNLHRERPRIGSLRQNAQQGCQRHHDKGVIVRIDSPGGEVTASDDMWRAMNELHKKKPVVISMSDDARIRRLLHGDVGRHDYCLSGDDHGLPSASFSVSPTCTGFMTSSASPKISSAGVACSDRIDYASLSDANGPSCAKPSISITRISSQGRRGAPERFPPSNRLRRAAFGWAIRLRQTVSSTNSEAWTGPSK